MNLANESLWKFTSNNSPLLPSRGICQQPPLCPQYYLEMEVSIQKLQKELQQLLLIHKTVMQGKSRFY